LQGGATFAAGKVGLGFRLDGTNGYVQIPDSDALKPTNVTVEAWVWCRDNNGFSIPSALIFGSLFFFKIICGFCPGISHCIMMGDFRPKTKQPKPGALRLKRKNTK
jgi:hypothetical protein